MLSENVMSRYDDLSKYTQRHEQSSTSTTNMYSECGSMMWKCRKTTLNEFVCTYLVPSSVSFLPAPGIGPSTFDISASANHHPDPVQHHPNFHSLFMQKSFNFETFECTRVCTVVGIVSTSSVSMTSY